MPSESGTTGRPSLRAELPRAAVLAWRIGVIVVQGILVGIAGSLLLTGIVERVYANIVGVVLLWAPLFGGLWVVLVGKDCSWVVVDDGVVSWRSLLGRRRDIRVDEVTQLRRYMDQRHRGLAVSDGDNVCRMSSRLRGFDDVEPALLSMRPDAVVGPSAYERWVGGAKPLRGGER